MSRRTLLTHVGDLLTGYYVCWILVFIARLMLISPKGEVGYSGTFLLSSVLIVVFSASVAYLFFYAARSRPSRNILIVVPFIFFVLFRFMVMGFKATEESVKGKLFVLDPYGDEMAHTLCGMHAILLITVVTTNVFSEIVHVEHAVEDYKLNDSVYLILGYLSSLSEEIMLFEFFNLILHQGARPRIPGPVAGNNDYQEPLLARIARYTGQYLDLN